MQHHHEFLMQRQRFRIELGNQIRTRLQNMRVQNQCALMVWAQLHFPQSQPAMVVTERVKTFMEQLISLDRALLYVSTPVLSDLECFLIFIMDGNTEPFFNRWAELNRRWAACWPNESEAVVSPATVTAGGLQLPHGLRVEPGNFIAQNACLAYSGYLAGQVCNFGLPKGGLTWN